MRQDEVLEDYKKEEQSTAFFIRPKKTIDEIQKIYGVKIPKEVFDPLADLTKRAIEQKHIEYLLLGCRKLGEKLGLTNEKLDGFTYDLADTLVFYYNALGVVLQVSEKEVS